MRHSIDRPRGKATLARAQVIAQALLAEELNAGTASRDSAAGGDAADHAGRAAAGDHGAAKVTAGIAAPYYHARLTSSDVSITNRHEVLSDEALEDRAAELQAKIAATRALN